MRLRLGPARLLTPCWRRLCLYSVTLARVDPQISPRAKPGAVSLLRNQPCQASWGASACLFFHPHLSIHRGGMGARFSRLMQGAISGAALTVCRLSLSCRSKSQSDGNGSAPISSWKYHQMIHSSSFSISA